MRRPGERGRVIFVLAANLLAALSACRSEPAPVVQPIAFDHALHMKKDMECATCHEHADTSIYATLPSNDVCMGCHDEPNGKNPEEPKVRELAQGTHPLGASEPPGWQRLLLACRTRHAGKDGMQSVPWRHGAALQTG